MYLEELSDKVWLTKISRFMAYRRIKRRRYGTYAFLSLFSVFIIGINLLVFMPQFEKKNTEITILTIILSVLILVVNLLIGQSNYQNREEDYLKCGKKLDVFNQRLRIQINNGDLPSIEEQKTLALEYYSILDRYKENHTNLDYEYAKCIYEYSKNKSLASYQSKIWAAIRWYLIDINVLIILTSMIVGILTFLLLI